MVGHQAIAADAHRHAIAGSGEEIDECLEIEGVVKEASTAVAATLGWLNLRYCDASRSRVARTGWSVRKKGRPPPALRLGG
jgi:hypothetical protein